MKRNRFYYFSGSRKCYVVHHFSDGPCEFTLDKLRARLFTEADWLSWGSSWGYEREEIGEDEVMRLIGAPMLPGLETQ